MKTHSFLIAVIGLFIIGLTSCSNPENCQGENEFLGTQKFQSEINELIPQRSSIRFVSEDGNEILLDDKKDHETTNRIIVARICGNGEIFTKNVVSYYDSDFASHKYSDDASGYEVFFWKSIRVENAQTTDEYFYDHLTIGFRLNKIGMANMEFNLSYRGNETVAETNTDDLDGKYDFNESVELGGMTYDNVYNTTPGNIPDTKFVVIYLTKEEGLLGFSDEEGVFWKLEK